MLLPYCRKVYVCSLWPSNHCSKWCPAELLVVGGTAMPVSPPIEGSVAVPTSPPSPAPGTTSPSALQSPCSRDTTPSSAHVLSTPMKPPGAPTKSQDSGSTAGRTSTSSAVRSLVSSAWKGRGEGQARSCNCQVHGQKGSTQRLTFLPAGTNPHTRTLDPLCQVPVFNRFAPAGMRASQLGARFMTLRPEIAEVADMQRQLSGSLQREGGRVPSDERTAGSARKRQRLQDTAGSGQQSQQQGMPR